MPYRIAGIDVHKKILAVVVADVAVEGEWMLERHKFGAVDSELRRLVQWLIEQEVQEVVMESTAQYWRPVWEMAERYWTPVMQQREGAGRMAGKLHLAQAQSNRAARGRKNDFRDAERLLRRLVCEELILSFVPDPEQRLWRTLTHRRYQLITDKVRFKNRLEPLLEQMHIKLSGVISDLLGVSGRRILRALAGGATDAKAVAELADASLRATPAQLQDALAACSELSPVYRRLLKWEMEELDFLEEQEDKLELEIADVLQAHAEAIQRLAEVPGLGVQSAQQIIALVGPSAAVFGSAKRLASWIGVCPGEQVSANQSHSTRSPKGNRKMRRVLNQAAHAAVKMNGSIFQFVFRRLLNRMTYKAAIWAIAHRLCRLIWHILHEGTRYEERGPAVSAQAQRTRWAKMVKELAKVGYRIAPPIAQPTKFA